MSTSRFDPHPTEPYGTCKNCEGTFATREETNVHLRETSQGGRSHTVRITNPTRDERIEREADMEADSLLDDFCSRLWDLVEREHVTVEEITEAVRRLHIDPAQAWAEFVKGSR